MSKYMGKKRCRLLDNRIDFLEKIGYKKKALSYILDQII